MPMMPHARAGVRPIAALPHVTRGQQSSGKQRGAPRLQSKRVVQIAPRVGNAAAPVGAAGVIYAQRRS
ncbi:hypothetical protein XHV734_4560 [Xanthomonas hortorum pv. vitians]|nr:hypothetical protein XHV734_4560 [Xanthomonas hortorum pv. vitians]